MGKDATGGMALPTLRDGVLTRRAVLALIGDAAITAGLGGCSGSEPEPAASEDVGGDEAEAPNTPVTVVEHAAPAHESEFAQLLRAGELRSIRLIGDSITAGYECDGYGATSDVLIYDGPYGAFLESADTVACWANDFREFAQENGVGEFVNAGVSGAKMRWLAEDAQAWVREGADAIFVMLGTNDSVYYTEDEYRSDAEVGLSAAAEACQHLVVMSPPRNAWRDYDPLYGADTLEAVLADLAQAHGWEFVSMKDSIQLGTDDFNEDQCHPSSKGSHAMWDYLRAALGL